MSRASALRLVLALLILGGSAAIALTASPRLGLDLSGGTQIVLQTSDSPTVRADAASTDRTLEVLRGRVDALGVSEPTLARSGQNRIIVELPGVQDPREALRVIGKTAQLTFHPVIANATLRQLREARAGGVQRPDERMVLRDESGAPLLLGPTAVPGDHVSDSSAGNDPSQGTGWFVTVDFKGSGKTEWRELTAKAACAPPGDPRRRVAIVLDDKVISSPQVDPSVPCGGGIPGGSTQITGTFTAQEADDLSILIKGGALPVPVHVVEQRIVGPTLGKEAIADSFQAGLIGLVLTGLFIAGVYRLMGLLATFALAAYALISYAVLVALGATLTLPGLAGFVLAIGMAIDANVLIFERAREEYSDGHGLRASLQIGFGKAWTAILDSNMTTLLAAGLLFVLASGPVKGFGVTLSIGVIASMVSAVIIARVLTEQAANTRWMGAHVTASGLAGTSRVRAWLRRKNPDIMGRGRLFLGLSAAALVIAVTGIVEHGLNLGVEFTGGRLMEYSTTEPISAGQARKAVSDAGFSSAVVQESDRDKITVRTGQIGNDEELTIRHAIAEAAGGATKQRDELVGPTLGSQLRDKALIAFGIALVVQMLYLGLRFKWTIGLSAVLAMFHDVVLVVGLFAWLGKPIDGVFLAAAMTIIGLSVNDSVVVFDRIRERWAGSKGRDFASVANEAAIETMPRTVNTGLGSMFILGALAVLGGDSLRDFAIALLVGLVIGTYSSVFTATPLAVLLHRRWPLESRAKVRRTRVARDPADSGAVV